jgi:ring-1,2-phenylacetyl-CoA epoxidase subunit PaaB
MTASDDTQWPRFEVFLQEKQGAAHQDVGSVHAPDIELALMNARDVFARRPDCISLWIVAAEDLTSRSRQELDAESPQQEQMIGEQQASYYVFAKLKPAGSQILVGEVQASSPKSALWKAQSQLEGLQAAPVISVCLQAAVYQSAETEAESLFSSAIEKPYRMATDFHTVTIMRQIREEGGSPQ